MCTDFKKSFKEESMIQKAQGEGSTLFTSTQENDCAVTPQRETPFPGLTALGL